ncbi:hypothetical protein Cal7507_3446 [Calothrix sp. PCC 7507]|nr:hypothetical protein Cal7507_3446 [Calothrix sp. PCC 7507]
MGGVHLGTIHHLISQGDHRQVRVREWVEQRRYTIEQVCGINIRETDFTYDRLAILLKRLRRISTFGAKYKIGV